MTCWRCGAPVARAGRRFCTTCGAPLEQQAGAPPQAPGGYPSFGPPPSGQPPYGPPPGPPRRSSSPLGLILGGAVVVLLLLAGVAYWALSQLDDPPLGIGRASAPTPTPSPAPTDTPRPGLGINVPGPQGTPTTITLPIPGINATVGLPNLPIPGISGSPGLPTITIPGASGTPPPSARLTADEARQKVKDAIASCRVLQPQIELSQVTFEAPAWVVRLPLSGATWRVDDTTGEVTPDERAAERVRTCRT